MRVSLTVGLAAMAAAALALSGCGQVREAFGQDKQAPDEFQVVARAPLSLPPDYSLRPPQPGAARPQEVAPRDQAAATIFGNTTEGPATVEAASSGEAAFLDNAGAAGVDPQIRELVDAETKIEIEQDQQFIDELIFWRDPDAPGVVIDPQKEQQRLQENAALGKPVTEGESPVVIRKKRALLEGLF